LNQLPLEFLFGAIIVLLILSAFFSSSETAMMSINRYRLKHLSKKGDRDAQRVEQLLQRPDRLTALFLIGNNLAKIFAAALTSVIAMRLLGDSGIVIGALLFTAILLIFAEIMPKALAALHPERLSFFCSLILKPLAYLLFPFVWTVNTIANNIAKLAGASANNKSNQHLHRHSEKPRTLADGAKAPIPDQHQGILQNILDLEKSTVEDIMVPRNEVEGLDLDEDIETLLKKIRRSDYTCLPLYRSDLNNAEGTLHLRHASRFLGDKISAVTHQAIKAQADEPYFIPDFTPLHTQLFNFQQSKRRIGLVVNEYGEVQGIVTLEDLLEEIVGNFTTNAAEEEEQDIVPQADGWHQIHGGTFVRDINRALDWDLPTDGPKTLNGLAIEYLESIPDAKVSFSLNRYRIETMEMTHKMITWFRVQMDPDID